MRIVKAEEFLRKDVVTSRPCAIPYDKEITPYDRWRYFPLICGHLSTPDTDELYHAFKPSRGLHWCETCSKWVELQPKAAQPLPVDPLF